MLLSFRSLRAQMDLDPNCIPALVSAITTRLFQPDNVRDKDWMLSSRQVEGRLAEFEIFTCGEATQVNGW